MSSDGWRRVGIGLLTAAALAGCAPSPTPPALGSLTIIGSRGEEAQLRILDDSGQLSDVAPELSEELRSDLGQIGLAAVPGRPSSLYVAWVVTPCQHDFLLRLSSSAEKLDIVVLDANKVPDCEARRVAYGIRLDFASAIDPRDVEASLVGG